MVWPSDSITRPAAILAASIALLAWTIAIMGRVLPPRHSAKDDAASAAAPDGLMAIYALLGMGAIGALFVVSQGVSGVALGSDNQSPAFLIAYQFSDLLVPAILLLMLRKGTTRVVVAVLVLYLAYSVFLGFRYRIVLMMIPLFVHYRRDITRSWPRLIGAIVISTVLLTLFGVMTLYRSKFSGLDFSQQSQGGTLFGAMAESNILFGFTSVLESYADPHIFYPLQPFIDALTDLIPRALLKSKSSGDYLLSMQINMGPEGAKSGTTYPMIGEFAIIGGYPAILFGTFAYAAVYLALRRLMVKRAPSPEAAIVGVALVAAIMGYYHLTRGFLPQAFKAYLFVILPYIVLLRPPAWLSTGSVARTMPGPA